MCPIERPFVRFVMWFSFDLNSRAFSSVFQFDRFDFCQFKNYSSRVFYSFVCLFVRFSLILFTLLMAFRQVVILDAVAILQSLGFIQWHRAIRMVFQPWKCVCSKNLMGIGRCLPLLLILTATLLIRVTAIKRNAIHSRNYITKVLFILTEKKELLCDLCSFFLSLSLNLLCVFIINNLYCSRARAQHKAVAKNKNKNMDEWIERERER